MSNDSVLSEDAGSLSHAARDVPKPPLSRTLAQVQPGRNRNFKFGSCPHHNCARSAFVFGPNAAPERRGRPYVFLVQSVRLVCFASRLFFLADNVARAFRAFVDSFFSVTRRMGAAEPLQRNGYACLFYIYYSMSCVNSLRICNKWWRMENGKRVCWHMVPATTEQWNDFPLAQKQKWQSLKYSLARGSRP